MVLAALTFKGRMVLTNLVPTVVMLTVSTAVANLVPTVVMLMVLTAQIYQNSTEQTAQASRHRRLDYYSIKKLLQ
jgi:hypothetical protein